MWSLNSTKIRGSLAILIVMAIAQSSQASLFSPRVRAQSSVVVRQGHGVQLRSTARIRGIRGPSMNLSHTLGGARGGSTARMFRNAAVRLRDRQTTFQPGEGGGLGVSLQRGFSPHPGGGRRTSLGGMREKGQENVDFSQLAASQGSSTSRVGTRYARGLRRVTTNQQGVEVTETFTFKRHLGGTGAVVNNRWRMGADGTRTESQTIATKRSAMSRVSTFTQNAEGQNEISHASSLTKIGRNGNKKVVFNESFRQNEATGETTHSVTKRGFFGGQKQTITKVSLVPKRSFGLGRNAQGKLRLGVHDKVDSVITEQVIRTTANGKQKVGKVRKLSVGKQNAKAAKSLLPREWEDDQMLRNRRQRSRTMGQGAAYEGSDAWGGDDGRFDTPGR